MAKPPVYHMKLTSIRLWRFRPPSEALLRPLLQGKVAADLGAGDCTGAFNLLALGADKVYVVDKNDFNLRSTLAGRAVKVTTYFEDWTPPAECTVAFISWPINYSVTVHHLLEMLPHFETVVYVGKNTDGTACATQRWFSELQYYPVLGFDEDRQDTLIAYDTRQKLDFPRPPCCEEELAGLTGQLVQYGARRPPAVSD